MTSRDVSRDYPVYIKLTDGSVVTSEPDDLYLDVIEPSDMILGRGKQTKLFVGIERPFDGTFQAYLIDSTKVINSEGMQFIRWYCRDSLMIQMREQDYVRITPEEGGGLWVLNATRTSALGEITTFTGRIPNDKITAIERRKPSTVTWVVVIASTAALLIGCIALFKNMWRGSLR